MLESGTPQKRVDYSDIEELIKRKPEIIMLCKRWWSASKNEIFHDPQNAHLRRETRQAG